MTREYLGLFDTPPGRREILFALSVTGALFFAFFAILPLSNVPLGEIIPFVPVVDAIVVVGELIIATNLYAQSAIFRSRALSMLASGFLSVAFLLIFHALTFPGAFARNGLLGAGLSSTAWLMLLRRIILPLTVVLYVILERADSAVPPIESRPRARVLVWIAGAVLLAGAVAALALRSDSLLPPLFVNRSEVNYFNNTAVNVANIAVDLFATVVLWRHRRSVLDIWLLVALAGWLIQSLLNLPLHARFTLGWYSLYIVILISHLVVLLALMGESVRLYSRLALATAARNRERESRIMSMDAVATAIAHEIRQPLTAMVTNAGAVLRWLDRDPLDPEAMARPAKAIIEDGHRASDVIEGIRSSLAMRTGKRTIFNLNELVRETGLLLDQELTSSQISLQFALDEALPPIRADRVQIQQVLVNLLINAVQSLDATLGRPRRIAIRSEPLGEEDLLLEVSDNGLGIAEEQMVHIFDYFFTTKASGTGIGLSLCRTIVEGHGGHLWASQGEQQGAIFHLQLPRNDSSADDDVGL